MHIEYSERKVGAIKWFPKLLALLSNQKRNQQKHVPQSCRGA